MANVFMAACMRSKVVPFHTNSTLKPEVQSVGALPDRSSSATCSQGACQDLWQSTAGSGHVLPPGHLPMVMADCVASAACRPRCLLPFAEVLSSVPAE